MKSEPSNYSFSQLKKDKTALWDGVRNYQARNFMMKDMELDDPILFYHSNVPAPDVPSVMGLAKVSKKAAPDPTCLDKTSPYYDPLSTKEKPRWWAVEIRYVKAFKKKVSLHDIKNTPQLKNMLVAQKGQRLSIQPVSKQDFLHILKMGHS